MRIGFTKCHGSGNDFPLVDARAMALDDAQWARIARALADRGGPVGGDGLLALTGATDGAAFGMRMWNPDGSEAETCLNGLRCTARMGFEATGRSQATVRLKVSSAEAAREAELAPGVATIRTRVGPVSLAPGDAGLRNGSEAIVEQRIDGLPSERAFTAVAMPNPHLVTFVDHVDEEELVRLGDWCEGGPPLIPGRANVSFVEVRGAALYVRTYERGVGLTDSCGSAMAASTLAACRTGRIAFDTETRVFNRGGLVRAAADVRDCVTIAGNATFLYDAVAELDPDGTAVRTVERTRDRSEEQAAWEGALERLR